MRYLSVCSGIEAATVAWHPLGWQPVGFAEIEPFPRAVLEQRHGAVAVDWDHRWTPGQNYVPLFGDFTQIEEHHVGPVDLLVGGTPCQAFSVAGKRLGLDDPRGNLTIEFFRLAKRVRARWVVWENVPGVLSNWSGEPDDDAITEWEETSDFAAILALFHECGYRGGWRVLDAQYVRVDGFERAVPQRRRRVFLVGHLGDDCRAFPVLFDPESLRGIAAPRRKAGQGAAVAPGGDPEGHSGAGPESGLIPTGTAGTFRPFGADGSGGPSGDECQNLVAQPVAHSLRAEGFDASEDGTGRGTPLVPVQVITQDSTPQLARGISPALKVGTGFELGQPPCVAGEVAPTLQAGGNTTGGHRPPGSTVDTVETLILAPAVAGTMKACAGRSGSPNGAEELDRMVAVPFDTTQITSRQNRSAPMPGDPCHPLAAGAHPPSIAFTVKDHGGDATEDVSPTLRSMGGQVAIAFQSQIARNARGQPDEICSALLAGGGGGATDRRPMAAIPTVDGWAVRKLTVRECERLQGLPDDFTAIRVRGREAADEPRYKAIGNSMAVNVMRWIGRRIDLIERAFAAAGGDHEA